MLIIDGHLDLAWNAIALGRDITQPLAVIRALEGDVPVYGAGVATVSLTSLRTAGVRAAIATIFAAPHSEHQPDGYHTAEEAYAQGTAQLRYYQQMEDNGEIRIIRTRQQLAETIAGEGTTPGVVLLLEGAEPLRTPADLMEFYAAGVRIVGPAWHATRYAGGTGEPGPLTEIGVELLQEMARMGVALDISHLAEEACTQAFALFRGFIIASHANARAITPVERNLTDAQLRHIADRNGIIGLVLYNRFIRHSWSEKDGKDAVSLNHLLEHARYIATTIGAKHLALGSDMDGGLGRDDIPCELDSCADYTKISDGLVKSGFTDSEIAGIMGGNWARVLDQLLPS